MHVTLTTLGQLRCRVVLETTAPARAAVLLCHGYGAGGDDLVALADDIAQRAPAAAAQVRFIFPEAPHALGGGRAAWWHFNVDALLQAYQRDAPAVLQQLRAHTPDGLAGARRLLRGCVDAVLQQTNLPMHQLLLGGFSQGAMLATDVTLHLEEPPAGLVVMSGALIDEVQWRKRAPLRRGLHVLQSHGTSDPLLPFDNAQALNSLLRDAGWVGEFMPFAGGHTIASHVVDRLAAWIAQLTGG